MSPLTENLPDLAEAGAFGHNGNRTKAAPRVLIVNDAGAGSAGYWAKSAPDLVNSD